MVDASAVPLLPGALELTSAGYVSGGTRNNMAYLEKWASVDDAVPVDVAVLLQDAQTSGGLLLASPRRTPWWPSSAAAGCWRRWWAGSAPVRPVTSTSGCNAAGAGGTVRA